MDVNIRRKRSSHAHSNCALGHAVWLKWRRQWSQVRSASVGNAMDENGPKLFRSISRPNIHLYTKILSSEYLLKLTCNAYISQMTYLGVAAFQSYRVRHHLFWMLFKGSTTQTVNARDTCHTWKDGHDIKESESKRVFLVAWTIFKKMKLPQTRLNFFQNLGSAGAFRLLVPLRRASCFAFSIFYLFQVSSRTPWTSYTRN